MVWPLLEPQPLIDKPAGKEIVVQRGNRVAAFYEAQFRGVAAISGIRQVLGHFECRPQGSGIDQAAIRHCDRAQ